MDHGAYTGELGYQLYKKYIDTNYMVYYDHPRKDQNDEPNCSHPIPFFDECSNATKLSYVDIAVVNKERDSIELIVEIEESGAEPKKVIGDVVNIVLSDQMRIKGKDYNYGKLTFILGVNVNPRGGSEEKTRMIYKKLIRINEKVGNKKIELIPVFDNDLGALIKKIESKINQKLSTV